MRSAFPNPLVVAAAALAASSYPAVGGDVEVVENTGRPGLGEWLRRNNRRRQTDGAFGAPKVKQRRQRLQRATGPGSLNETNELRALIEGGEKEAAAEYYKRCKNINYRAGRPKMRWGDVWYFAYKAAMARGEIT